MSFLGSLVGSIGNDKSPAPPNRPTSRPNNTNVPVPAVPRSAPSTPAAESNAKPVYRGTAGGSLSQQGGSLKRKAEDISSERSVKLQKPSVTSNSDRNGQKPARPNGRPADACPTYGAVTKSSTSSKPANGTPATQAAPVTKPKAKSYAELMAAAKAASSTKSSNNIGMIHHKSTERVKPISKMDLKLAERKKEEQEKPRPGSSSKSGANGRIDPRRRSASPVKRGERELPKQPKKAQPPLHGPPAYKGTMGSAPKRSRDDGLRRKSSKYDDYLGTDEEDEGEYGYDDEDEDHYGSDGSEDMEGGGFDELEREERMAERIAREEDAKELALEQKLKKEKLDRKQKLAMLAKKQQR